MKNIHEDSRGFSTENFGGGYFYEESKKRNEEWKSTAVRESDEETSLFLSALN